MLGNVYAGFWDLWHLYHKCIFDGINRIIHVSPGVTELDVKQDLYSDWKEWVQQYDNSKWVPAFRVTGGDPLPGDRFLGGTFFLINGWRIKPWQGDYRLQVNGNLYTEEGDNPYLPAPTPSNILIQSTVSNLVDTIAPQVDVSSIDFSVISDSVWDTVIQNTLTAADMLRKIRATVSDNQGLILAK